MDAVLELAGVTVRRGDAVLLDSVDWTVEEDERWVVLGPNGAGKTTLLQVASARIHPTAGVAGILGEVLGTVDVFELRPRIGLTSAALADLIPRTERVHKRVQIARALMTDPELLLLDEPAAGLDLGGREDLVSTLSVLAMDEEAPATVLVSHHVEEIPPGFTHGLLLRRGAVVAAGPLEQVMTEEVLSATFGMPLRLSHADGRWAARRRTRRRAG